MALKGSRLCLSLLPNLLPSKSEKKINKENNKPSSHWHHMLIHKSIASGRICVVLKCWEQRFIHFGWSVENASVQRNTRPCPGCGIGMAGALLFSPFLPYSHLLLLPLAGLPYFPTPVGAGHVGGFLSSCCCLLLAGQTHCNFLPSIAQRC